MRPWRLTRRQRVDMEAALAGLRADVVRRRIAFARLAEACRRAGGREYVAIDGRPIGMPSDVRTLRARVALALRAALRADEDARCEEARGPEDSTSWGYDSGREDGVDAMREWPPLRQLALCGDDLRVYRVAVPLALWEVAR